MPDPLRPFLSASNWGIAELCPGSLAQREAAFREGRIPPEDPAAEEGTRLHRIIANAPAEPGAEWEAEHGDLDQGTREAVIWARRRCEEIAAGSMVSAWEYPVTLFLGEGEQLTGRVDRIAIFRDRVAVVDNKMGRDEPILPLLEAQARVYAYGAMQKCNLRRAEVYVLLARKEREYRQTYEWSDAALDGIRATYRAVHADGAPLRPSREACTWCEGKLACSAFSENFLAPESAGRALTKGAPSTVMDPIERARMLEVADLLGAWAEDVRSVTKAQILSGEIVVPGWAVAEVPKRVVKDLRSIVTFLLKTGVISLDDILGTLSAAIGKLEKLWLQKIGRTFVNQEAALDHLWKNLKPAIGRRIEHHLKRKEIADR